MVDYALQRRALLADVFAGRLGVSEVCDAHPYLLRAAKYHGELSDSMCPVCRKERLTHVQYVYGDRLKAGSGQAKSMREVASMAARLDEFTVYVVEVCRTCGWNHLNSSFVTGGRPAEVSSDRRAATE